MCLKISFSWFIQLLKSIFFGSSIFILGSLRGRRGLAVVFLLCTKINPANVSIPSKALFEMLTKTLLVVEVPIKVCNQRTLSTYILDNTL